MWKSEKGWGTLGQVATMKKIKLGLKLRKEEEVLQHIRQLCQKHGFSISDIDSSLKEED